MSYYVWKCKKCGMVQISYKHTNSPLKCKTCKATTRLFVRGNLSFLAEFYDYDKAREYYLSLLMEKIKYE